MRYSNTSVEQFHLKRLVDGIEKGRIGIPEFQRDFDWNENDVRSLLSTVFAGWPAGSLLLLEGNSELFAMRSMDAAPPLTDIMFGVLDGQQRLTSLYQALTGVGESRFAIRWDIARDQDIEEGIVSFRLRAWDRYCASLDQQIDMRIIPLTALRSPTDFFVWRDNLLEQIQDIEKRNNLKEIITDLYTYRLSAIHDYEFPVVRLDREIEPSAIARIFEKVNKTGLTLNTFDLLVAKSYDPVFNLRDRWNSAREKYRDLASFFGDDGLPLLQAISLLKKSDLRQAAVLDLTKHDIQREWENVAAAAANVVQFLRDQCGVLRRDFMPYINMLPPLVALEARGKISESNRRFQTWFWNAGFGGMYESAANTRLMSHYKQLTTGNHYQPLPDEDLRIADLTTASRRSRKALWATINCAIMVEMEKFVGFNIPEDTIAELEPSLLFSLDEVRAVARTPFAQDADAEFRGSLNSLFVPKRHMNLTKKLDAFETYNLCRGTDFEKYLDAQLLVTGGIRLNSWSDFRVQRCNWLLNFMRHNEVTGITVAIFQDNDHGYNIVTI